MTPVTPGNTRKIDETNTIERSTQTYAHLFQATLNYLALVANI